MNLFVAVVLQGFQESTKENEAAIVPMQYELFLEKWNQYDNEGIGLLDSMYISFILNDIQPPIGC